MPIGSKSLECQLKRRCQLACLIFSSRLSRWKSRQRQSGKAAQSRITIEKLWISATLENVQRLTAIRERGESTEAPRISLIGMENVERIVQRQQNTFEHRGNTMWRRFRVYVWVRAIGKQLLVAQTALFAAERILISGLKYLAANKQISLLKLINENFPESSDARSSCSDKVTKTDSIFTVSLLCKRSREREREKVARANWKCVLWCKTP